MQRYRPFSGDKPTLEDLEFNQDGLEAAILDRQSEMFSDGIVSGLDVVKDEGGYFLQPGVAYIGGERIEVKEIKDLGIEPGVDKKQICIRHTTTTSNPKQHFVTGDTHNVWVEDSWTVVLHDGSETIPEGDLLLAVLHPDGSLEDKRTYIEVRTDPRIHEPNTDTHTTANEFHVGGPTGSLVLTTDNMLTASDILANLFQRGVIDLLDGHGERQILTRKIPSKPNRPAFSSSNIRVRVDEPNGSQRNISLALETYTRKQIASQTLSSQITSIDELRALVANKQLMGYTLDQIRGDADVGDAPDLEVRRAKNRLVVNGALSNTRQPGTLTVTKNLTSITGSGTSFTSSLVGKAILMVGLGSDPVEYEVASVQSSTALTLTSPIVEDSALGLAWYLSNAPDVGFDGDSTTTISGLLAKVDTTLNSKVTDRSSRIAERDEQAQVLLQEEARTQLGNGSLRTYTLIAEWDKPALIDLEEIVGYQVRVVKLDDGMTEVPSSPTVQAFTSSGSYATLVKAVNDVATPRRQKVELVDVEDTVASGSTTSVIAYTKPESFFKVNARVLVDGQSRVIRSVDPVAKTITLSQALPSAPISGKAIQAFAVTYESDVTSERFLMPVTAGKRYVLFLRSLSEYGLVSDWTSGVVVRTDDLPVAGGQTLNDIALEESRLRVSLQTVQRDQLTADWNEQLFSMQRVIAATPTREEFVALQSEVITGEINNPAS